MFRRFVATGVLALVVVLAPSAAFASSLTPLQISSIVALLQAFGASQSVIANVQAQLSNSIVSPGTAFAATTTPSSAVFNASSLTYYLSVSSSGTMTLSGTASGVSRLLITLKSTASRSSSPDLSSVGAVPVVNGKWSVAVSPTNFGGTLFYDGSSTVVRGFVPVGSYVVSLFNADTNTFASSPLASGTLVVK